MIAKRFISLIPSSFIQHIRLPLFKNGYALILSSGASSALGFFYWILAARLFTTSEVGLNAAVLSASFFISSVAQFNLTDALIRFLPEAGRSTRRLILVSYLISTVVIGLVCVIFLVGIPLWAPELSPLISNPSNVLQFVLFTAAYGIFALQDSALTGIRQAVWVPIENIIFSILKIALLFVFASAALNFGIMSSWMIPSVLIVLLVNVFLFFKLVPKHAEATASRSQQVTRSMVTRYVAGDYLGGLFWIGVTSLQTVVVTHILGPTQSAHFYLVWQIANGLYMVSRLMGMSLVAEVVTDPIKFREYHSRALRQISRIILPIVAVILIISPWVLQLYGQDYADNGTALLRLLAISAIPQMVIALKLSDARIQRNSFLLFAIQASESIVTFMFIPTLLNTLGITGVGWAWLSGQMIVALVILYPDAIKFLEQSNSLNRMVRIIHTIRTPWSKNRDDRLLKKMNTETLPLILAKMPTRLEGISPSTWCARRIIPTVTDMIVIPLGSDLLEPEAVMKLATSESAAKSLAGHNRNLTILREDPRLEDLRDYLPKLLFEGEVNGQFYSIETMLQGQVASDTLSQPAGYQHVLAAASAFIGDLHRRTQETIQIDPITMNHWVDERLLTIQRSTPYRYQKKTLKPHIDRLADELHQALSGRYISTGWIHGDFSPGNILMTPDGKNVVGVVDWELAAIDHPLLDLMHLLLSLRMQMQKREMGNVILDLMEGAAWSPEEQALFNTEQQFISGDSLNPRILLLLCWLRHVSYNITKSSIYGNHWLWFSQNVGGVLRKI